MGFCVVVSIACADRKSYLKIVVAFRTEVALNYQFIVNVLECDHKIVPVVSVSGYSILEQTHAERYRIDTLAVDNCIGAAVDNEDIGIVSRTGVQHIVAVASDYLIIGFLRIIYNTIVIDNLSNIIL